MLTSQSSLAVMCSFLVLNTNVLFLLHKKVMIVKKHDRKQKQLIMLILPTPLQNYLVRLLENIKCKE